MHVFRMYLIFYNFSLCSYVKSRKKTGIIVKFDSEIKITSCPLTPSWNKLHILMHNIVLHISIYLFPWLHISCYLSPINNARKHAISAILISVFFWNINFWWMVCLNMCSYAHNAPTKMKLRIMGVNTFIFTPT